MNNGLFGFAEAPVAKAGLNNVQSSAVAVLNAGSAPTQNVAFSAPGLAVVMPVATQLTASSMYMIRNTGALAFDVQDSSTTVIFAQLQPGSAVLVWLRDNTTAAGLWAQFSPQGQQTVLSNGLASYFGAATAGNGMSSCPLNGNQALVCYGNVNTGYFNAVVLTSSGGASTVVTAGTPVTFGYSPDAPTPYAIACCQVANNSAVVVTGDGRVWGVTTSGSVPTMGAAVNFSNGSGIGSLAYAVSVSLVSANTVLIATQSTTSNGIYTTVATVNGLNVCVNGQANSLWQRVVNNTIGLTNIGVDTILATYQDAASGNIYGVVYTGVAGIYTPGPAQVLCGTASTNYQIQVCALGNNQAMLFYCDAANSNYQTAMVISIAGTTLTANAKQVIQNYASPILTCCQTSNGNALVLLFNGANFQLFALTVSGTAITVGAGVTATTVANNTAYSNVLIQTNNNKAILFFNTSSTTSVYAAVVSVSGTTVTYNAVTSLSASSTAAGSLAGCQTGTDQATVTYPSGGQKSVVCISSATTTATFGTPVSTTLSGAYPCALMPTAASGAFALTAYNYAVAGTIAAGVITTGATTPIWYTSTGGAASAISGCYSSAGRVLVATTNQTAGYVGETMLVNAQISGTTVTTPTFPASCGTGTASANYYCVVSAPSGTGNAALGYLDSGLALHAVYVTVSGFGVSYGANLQFAVAPNYGVTLIPATSNTFVAGYIGASSVTFYAMVLTASGTTLSAGSPLQIGSTGNAYVAFQSWLCMFNSSTVAACFASSTSTYQIDLLTLNGTALTPTIGSPYTLTTASTIGAFYATPLGANKIMVVSNATNGNGFGQAVQYVKV